MHILPTAFKPRKLQERKKKKKKTPQKPDLKTLRLSTIKHEARKYKIKSSLNKTLLLLIATMQHV